MTEQEWLSCDSPQAMLAWLQAREIGTHRRWRLFACAAARRLWRRLATEPSAQDAIRLMERLADGQATESERHSAWRRSWGDWGSMSTCPTVPLAASRAAACVLDRDPRGAAIQIAVRIKDGKAQVDLLRCLFGHAFRPSSADPTWLRWNGGTIPKLAQTIYEDRVLPSGHLRRGRIAFLADMLEDAGCTDSQILEHLRGKGPHVRGCFVVDLLTARS